jgi:hypothetical protein
MSPKLFPLVLALFLTGCDTQAVSVSTVVNGIFALLGLLYVVLTLVGTFAPKDSKLGIVARQLSADLRAVLARDPKPEPQVVGGGGGGPLVPPPNGAG